MWAAAAGRKVFLFKISIAQVKSFCQKNVCTNAKIAHWSKIGGKPRAKTAQGGLLFLVSLLVKVLSKCRFSPVPPYFSQSASLQGFGNLLNVGKLVYEICFFFANRTFHLLLLKSFCV
jgi:hypothetical protein